MNLIDYALIEIDYLHIEDKNKVEYLKKFVTEFLKTMSGHSNNSAPYAIGSFIHYTKDKNFVDLDLSTIDIDTCNVGYELIKKYHELVNTEEFIVQDIDENKLKDILYKVMSWKPVSPLQGTDDEWYGKDHYIIDDDTIQNKRYSPVFKNIKTGECYNIDGKVFEQNKMRFTSRDSIVPVTFPYTVPDEPELVILEDYIPVPNSPLFYIQYPGDRLPTIFGIGYLKSTLDDHINNLKFHKAFYCILSGTIEQYPAPFEWTPDEPMYRFKIDKLFSELIDRFKTKHHWKVYKDKECTEEY
ncbi:MAG: hypothetical protein IJ193_00625 [Bacilli bacterium]|nr:hypothetical protein [Bacilli bacterium]